MNHLGMNHLGMSDLCRTLYLKKYCLNFTFYFLLIVWTIVNQFMSFVGDLLNAVIHDLQRYIVFGLITMSYTLYPSLLLGFGLFRCKYVIDLWIRSSIVKTYFCCRS